MSDKDLITALGRIEAQLAHIAAALGQSALPEEPGYSRDLAAYQNFDWGVIGAEPVEYDAYGATIVRWGGYEWSRKTSKNKFGEAILFSRHVGRENKEYLTLIKFKSGGEVEPPAFALPQLAPPAAVVITQPPQPPTHEVAPLPTEQPFRFLAQMRRTYGINDEEIKRRLKIAGVTGFPTDEAKYGHLENIMAQMVGAA